MIILCKYESILEFSESGVGVKEITVEGEERERKGDMFVFVELLLMCLKPKNIHSLITEATVKGGVVLQYIDCFYLFILPIYIHEGGKILETPINVK